MPGDTHTHRAQYLQRAKATSHQILQIKAHRVDVKIAFLLAPHAFWKSLARSNPFFKPLLFVASLATLFASPAAPLSALLSLLLLLPLITARCASVLLHYLGEGGRQ